MESTPSSAPVSKAALWTGRILSLIPVLMLLLSAVMKLARPPAVLEGFAKFGWSADIIVALGILELACTIIYLIPRTAVLGAILVTGYLGGAIATTVRVGDPSWVLTALLGVFVWGGLYLRDPRLRALIPLQR
ncbi:MAG TPA: DoxX family protein [Opitutaceae bacterium]|nr:DoxX family protein [Opitutaceae bacterium]